MIGVLIIAVIIYLLLIGKNRGLLEKIVVASLIVGSYIYFLHSQGATPKEIIEILFPFLF